MNKTTLFIKIDGLLISVSHFEAIKLTGYKKSYLWNINQT